MGTSSKALTVRYTKSAVIASAILVPCLALINPRLLAINGVGPSWVVLWLLPWSLAGGPLLGSFAGLCLGLLLDSISLYGATQIPALIVLGFWWGRLGKVSSATHNNLSLGLLAYMGSFCVGISLWLQFYLRHLQISFEIFHSWSFQTILSQSLITGLLSPIISFWLLLYFKNRRS